MDAGVWDTVVAEGEEGGEAGGVGQVAVVGEDVDVGAEGPDLWGWGVSGWGWGRGRGGTFWPAMRQRDSVERAWERRRVVSRMRERWVSRSLCLGGCVSVVVKVRE